jgi:hypothetical protein
VFVLLKAAAQRCCVHDNLQLLLRLLLLFMILKCGILSVRSLQSATTVLVGAAPASANQPDFEGIWSPLRRTARCTTATFCATAVQTAAAASRPAPPALPAVSGDGGPMLPLQPVQTQVLHSTHHAVAARHEMLANSSRHMH